MYCCAHDRTPPCAVVVEHQDAARVIPCLNYTNILHLVHGYCGGFPLSVPVCTQAYTTLHDMLAPDTKDGRRVLSHLRLWGMLNCFG